MQQPGITGLSHHSLQASHTLPKAAVVLLWLSLLRCCCDYSEPHQVVRKPDHGVLSISTDPAVQQQI